MKGQSHRREELTAAGPLKLFQSQGVHLARIQLLASSHHLVVIDPMVGSIETTQEKVSKLCPFCDRKARRSFFELGNF